MTRYSNRRKPMPMIERCIVTLVWLAIGIFVLRLFLPSVPKQLKTGGTMATTKRRILQYCNATGSIPESLEVLPTIPGKSNSIKDAWGKELVYTVTGMTVELRSYGADRKLGGAEDARDLVGTFALTTEEGEWSPELVRWRSENFRSID